MIAITQIQVFNLGGGINGFRRGVKTVRGSALLFPLVIRQHFFCVYRLSARSACGRLGGDFFTVVGVWGQNQRFAGSWSCIWWSLLYGSSGPNTQPPVTDS